MQVVNLSQNDSLNSVIQKCNINFKELAFSSNQALRKQSRMDNESTRNAIDEAVDDLGNIVIPNEVSSQISALDIPGLIANAVSSAFVTDSTNVVSDFLTADTDDVVVVNGIAHRWGNIAKISLTYRFKDPYVVMSDGKINNKQLGTLTSDWMTVGGLTNVSLDTTRQVEGVIDNYGLIAFMSANSRGTSYTIDENAVLYAGFMYMLAGE